MLLALCMLLSISLCSCNSTGEAMLKLGKTEISENMFVFWLSRYKAQFEYAYGSALQEAYGVSSSDDFWKLTYTEGNGTDETYDSRFTDYIYQNAMTYLVALYLFDEYGLSISKDEKESIDEYIDGMIEDYASGSENEFNVILAEYGFNLATLRACYETDAKISALQDYLFGKGGPEEISSADLEAYYEKTYVRMEQICIFLDECPEKADDGTYITDSEGQISYREMSVAETEAARAKANEALTKLNNGESFSTVLAQYNENTESTSYTNGIYLSSDTVYSSGDDATTLYETLLDMNAGEYKLVELEHTLHIIRKLELDSGAYSKTANADFFSFYDSSIGEYVSFSEYVKTPFFLSFIEEKQKELNEQIKIDSEVKEKHTIASVKANPYF